MLLLTRILAATAPTRGSANGRSQGCIDPKLDYRIGVSDHDELASRHADADIERARLAVAARRREDPHTVPYLRRFARDTQGCTSGDGQAVVFRVVVDENDFEVRIAAEQRPTNGLADRG